MEPQALSRERVHKPHGGVDATNQKLSFGKGRFWNQKSAYILSILNNFIECYDVCKQTNF